ncbi:tail fiber assembly protein [Escherichia coli]|uniref:Tail fiber assembly protein n=1 Tax=Escherichia coli TaxID=562 RepID=A0A2X3K758_ECOLX|nr:tail fiber assembly protein [Escherichia coli]
MFKDGAVVKRIYTADEQQQQAESQKAVLLSEAESVIQPLERAVRLNMATDEERTRLEAWNATVFWSAVWIRQILNGHKSLNKN